MKIIHISTYPPRDKKDFRPGGVAWYEKKLINSIKYHKDDNVFLLCEKIHGKYEEYIENNIKVIRCFDKKPIFVFQLYRVINKINPDIIHFQQELALYGNILTAYLLQWLVFSLRKFKIIITLHGVVSLKSIDNNFIKENSSNLPVLLVKFAFWIIYKPLCLFTKKVVVHEDFFKQILVNEYKIKSDKIKVINLGIDNLKPIGKKEACKNLNINSNKDIVLFMGYLTGYKGLDLLIEGFSLYSKNNPKAFLIIGAGKHPKLFNDEKYLREYSRIKNKAKELIANNQYKWIGFIKENDIINYYSASDVSVYPYTVNMSSSGPMAIALAYEKPFLASDVYSTLIKDKNMIFKRDKNDLNEKLMIFFQNKKNLETIKIMKSERLWDKIAKKTRDLYAQTV